MFAFRNLKYGLIFQFCPAGPLRLSVYKRRSKKRKSEFRVQPIQWRASFSTVSNPIGYWVPTGMYVETDWASTQVTDGKGLMTRYFLQALLLSWIIIKPPNGTMIFDRSFRPDLCSREWLRSCEISLQVQIIHRHSTEEVRACFERQSESGNSELVDIAFHLRCWISSISVVRIRWHGGSRR